MNSTIKVHEKHQSILDYILNKEIEYIMENGYLKTINSFIDNYKENNDYKLVNKLFFNKYFDWTPHNYAILSKDFRITTNGTNDNIKDKPFLVVFYFDKEGKVLETPYIQPISEEKAKELNLKKYEERIHSLSDMAFHGKYLKWNLKNEDILTSEFGFQFNSKKLNKKDNPYLVVRYYDKNHNLLTTPYIEAVNDKIIENENLYINTNLMYINNSFLFNLMKNIRLFLKSLN